MKSKGKKKEELDDLKTDLTDAKNLFVAQFQGMTVAQDTSLRMKIRESKSKYRVVKNTLAKKAAQGTPAEGVAKKFEGSTAIAFNANDPVSLAKRFSFESDNGEDVAWNGQFGFHDFRVANIKKWFDQNPQYVESFQNKII